MARVNACSIPPESQLQTRLADADFHDAWCVNNPYPECSALALAIQTLGRAPSWVNAAMRVRNAIVRRLGLKDLGALAQLNRDRPLQSYRVGDRVGIFTLMYLSDDEVILGDDDKHLDVQVSVLKTVSGQAVISTIVHIHNMLGRIYMLFVAPAHRIIAPSVISRLRRTEHHE